MSAWERPWLSAALVLLVAWPLECVHARPPEPMHQRLASSAVLEPDERWSLLGTGAEAQSGKAEFASVNEAVAVWTAFMGSKALCGASFSIAFGPTGVNWQQTASITTLYGNWVEEMQNGVVVRRCTGAYSLQNRFVIPGYVVCPNGFERLGWSEDAAGNPASDAQRVRLRQVCASPRITRAACHGECPPNSTPSYTVGNPIAAATRTKLQTETVVPARTPGGLSFSGHYRSDTRQWRHNYSTRAIPIGFGTAAGACYENMVPLGAESVARCLPVAQIWDAAVLYDSAGGREVTYVRGSDGSYRSLPGEHEAIMSVDPGDQSVTVLTADNWLQRFDAVGRPVEWVHVSGQRRLFMHSTAATSAAIAPGPGLLISVADGFGRALALRYDANAALAAVTDVDGSVYELATTPGGPWTRITFPDRATRSLIHDEPAHVIGQGPRQLLTGVVDELGLRIGTYRYDAEGMALSTEGADGTNRFAWQAPSSFVSPLGEVQSFAWSQLAGSPRLVPISMSRSCSDCGSDAVRIVVTSYDANGNRATEDDSASGRRCFVHDASRSVELVRVEGVGALPCGSLTTDGAPLPAGARRITTRWHPQWRLQTGVAEPGRITTFVYNGQSDPFNGNAIARCAPADALLPGGAPIAVLCKQVEQASTDADGAAGFATTLQPGVAPRVNTWTYNGQGQVLTHDGPRTDVQDVTTFVYYGDTTAEHSIGDLASVTDALGRTTLYRRYNRQGQLLQSTDPNGVDTVNTYDTRQRLRSTSVAGVGAIFSYDAAGQLRAVTRQNGSLTAFRYDAARRLVWQGDAMGNRVEYTLDAAGNRIGEVARDISGVVRRQVLRVYDGFGRLRKTTGGE